MINFAAYSFAQWRPNQVPISTNLNHLHVLEGLCDMILLNIATEDAIRKHQFMQCNNAFGYVTVDT